MSKAPQSNVFYGEKIKNTKIDFKADFGPMDFDWWAYVRY